MTEECVPEQRPAGNFRECVAARNLAKKKAKRTAGKMDRAWTRLHTRLRIMQVFSEANHEPVVRRQRCRIGCLKMKVKTRLAGKTYSRRKTTSILTRHLTGLP